VPVEDVVHSHHTGRHGVPPGERRQCNPASLASTHRNVTYQPDHELGGPRRSLCSRSVLLVQPRISISSVNAAMSAERSR
jgi:hypothetical protein